jgi:hypothetical protein
MQRHHGRAGRFVSEAIQLTLYALIWLRHRFRDTPESERKRRAASAAIRLLTGFTNHDPTIRHDRQMGRDSVVEPTP